MATITASLFTALDGVVDPGVGQWHFPYFSEELGNAVAGTHDADVKFCPGDRTHFQLLQREGFRDSVAYHPGPFARGEEDFSRFYACLGSGRIALPKT